MHAFQDGCKCFIMVDASLAGLGAVLGQWVSGKEHTIAFSSRMLKQSETHYSTIECEALACVWAIDKFKNYIWGREFELFTDHKPLTHILSGTGLGKASARLVRLLSKLQEFHFSIKHISGGKNFMADCLSRMALHDVSEVEDFENTECVVAALDAIKECTGIT